MDPNCGLFKVCVSVPPEFVDELLDGINDIIDPIYPHYDRTFAIYPVTGTWRPLEGSNPYKGRTGEIETASEMRIEFAVKREQIERVISKIAEIHPYEEPCIDVIPLIGWKDFLIPLA